MKKINLGKSYEVIRNRILKGDPEKNSSVYLRGLLVFWYTIFNQVQE